MITKYMNEQSNITTLLNNSIKTNKIVQAYMFFSNDINYLLDFAKEFSKDLIGLNLNQNIKDNISKKIDLNIYDELKIVEPINNIIKKEQIEDIKKFISTKPIEGNKKIYIIKNCEKLNIASANSMLKFVEEANKDVIAIFLTTNIDMVIPTIKSRCQILNFNINDNKSSYNFLDYSENLNEEEIDIFITKSFEFAEYIEKYKLNCFYKSKEMFNLKTREEMSNLLNLLLYIYYDSFNYKILKKIKYFNKSNEIGIIKFIAEKSIDEIISKIIILEKIRKEFNYNLNLKLTIDRIIIELSEV